MATKLRSGPVRPSGSRSDHRHPRRSQPGRQGVDLPKSVHGGETNKQDGTFTVDEARAPAALRHNPPESWYHLEGHLADLDNDGDLDLTLGQNRDIFPSTVNQFSVVLINDGTGHYPARIELPRPAFNDGYTSVRGQTHFDVNEDGFQDLLVVHPRNDDGPPDVIPWTGRHIQVLINRGTPSHRR